MPQPRPGRPRTGSVFRHGDHFDVQVTYPNGKRSPRACLAPTIGEAEARALAKKYSDDAARAGGPVAPAGATPKKGETFNTWTARWFEARGARGLQVEADRLRFAKWVLRGAGLGDRPVASITRSDVEGLVEYLDAKVRAGVQSWKTAANTWGLVSKAFADAHNAKERALRVREDNPAAGVRGPDRGGQKAKQWLHPADVLRVLALADEPLELRRAVALQVYLYTRPGELRALEWTDVDLDAGIVRVHRAEKRDGTIKATKTKTTRPVPIEPTLAPLLAAMREETGGKGRVATGMPRDEYLADVLVALLKRAGIERSELFLSDATRKRITWYDLRATGVTWRAIRGDEPLRIMRGAGHNDFATTLGYIREAEAVGASFGNVFPPLPSELYERGVDRDRRVSLSNRSEVSQPLGILVGRQGLEPQTERQIPPKTDVSDVATDATDGGKYANARAQSETRSESAAPPASLDAVEAALATALERASAAGEWSVVGQLARELEARRTARAASNVVDLEARRRDRR